MEFFFDHTTVGKRGIKSELVTYFNVMKDCDFFDCAHPQRGGFHYKTYNGKQKLSHEPFDDGQFILNDGTFVAIESPSGGTSEKFISVDVNGLGGQPNRLGRDLFMFEFSTEGKIVPMGSVCTKYSDLSKYCSSSSNDPMNGAGCTAKVLEEK